jgi:hypothetical protein
VGSDAAAGGVRGRHDRDGDLRGRSLAERRIAMLVDPALSGLPAFLTPRPVPLPALGGTSAASIEASHGGVS